MPRGTGQGVDSVVAAGLVLIIADIAERTQAAVNIVWERGPPALATENDRLSQPTSRSLSSSGHLAVVARQSWYAWAVPRVAGTSSSRRRLRRVPKRPSVIWWCSVEARLLPEPAWDRRASLPVTDARAFMCALRSRMAAD